MIVASLSVPVIAQAPAPSGNSSLIQLALMVGVVILYYYLFIGWPQRRMARERRDMLMTLKKNDRVLTSGGIYGTVIAVDDKNEKVTVRICDDPAVRIQVNVRNVARLLSKDEESA